MNRRRIFVVAAAGLCAAVWTYACGDGATEPPTPPPDPPRPATVAVAPATVQLTELGATEQLTAEVRDQNGNAMAGAAVSWASSAASVATVSSTGLVTAVGNGTATITATAGSASGSATVTVAQEVSAVAVSPAADTLVAGDTLRLAAEADDANGHTVAGAEFTWASSDTLVAVVDDAGLVTGHGAGEAEVTATTAGVAGRADFTVVAPAPTTIAITPDTVALTALGQTAQLAAEVRDQIGRVMEGVPVSWSSADRLVAAVDSEGLVTAIGGGATTITATAGEVSGTAVVKVMQLAGLVVVSPVVDTVALGNTLRLVAEAFDENGSVVDGADFTWSSSDVSVATVDAMGLVTGIAEGTATITATAGGASGTSQITVANPDRVALVALYNATDGLNWVNNDNWLTDAPLGDWYGVDTNAAGRVTRLDLSGQRSDDYPFSVPHGLSGTLPPKLGNLTNLTQLDLPRNNLGGPIPTELGNLSNLAHLDLSHNKLSGSIPPELGNLASLSDLVLVGNDLSGPIPPELGNLANLRDLSLSRNAFSGPIPPALGNLANLRFLNLWFNILTGPVPPELGNLTNLWQLALGRNSLSGPIPPGLGNLTNLRHLNLADSELVGPIPQSFQQISELEGLGIGGSRLCVPGSSGFFAWLSRVERHDIMAVSYCNANDVSALESLYETAAGADWTESSGWLNDGPVEEWYGVSADSLGQITALDLTRNGLAGDLSPSLGSLNQLRVLRLGGNALAGPLPQSLARVPLQELRYADTQLCAPGDASFQSWLKTVASHEGTGAVCTPLSDRDILKALYNATHGPSWDYNRNWLSNAPLHDWGGVGVDAQGRVASLSLSGINLSGPIPPELGSLANLKSLDLRGNNLSGPIPAELGSLADLAELSLGSNDLTGPLPPVLGSLTNLSSLDLRGNNLSGSIPAELGNLTNLAGLFLGSNELTGSIPRELGSLSGLRTLELSDNHLAGLIPSALGNLSELETLALDNNDLAGGVPSHFGRVSSLRQLTLANNRAMAGVLPSALTSIPALEELFAGGTGLCAPTDPVFQDWLNRIQDRWVVPCTEGDPPMAYLTQAVQSREHPVPLVAGKRALLRVFPTARQATTAGIPSVRVRFYVDGRETHVEEIPGKSTPLPTDVDESSLSMSANAEIPAGVIQPGLEMVIDIDPEETLDPALGVAKRIPETGRLNVEVLVTPLLDLTLIPFIWSETQDSLSVDFVAEMAADPENSPLLWETRTLLPVGEMDVTAHEPVLTSSNVGHDVFRETAAIRAMEGGTGHYVGMLHPPTTGTTGVATLGGKVSFSNPGTMAHELGHNMNLGHAPCGVTGDPSFPHPNGSVGVWGYDFRYGEPVWPDRIDLMAYCGGSRWISDYHFTKALRYRLIDEGAPAAAQTRSLLLWGGVGADSVPYLEPAFLVNAPALLPASAGAHQITGRSASGSELFSLGFTMPETADRNGSSSFAFVLPVQAGWEGSLASITLSGPSGSVTLDGESDIPVAILRNPRTGQIRGILRDLASATQVAADASGQAAGPGLEVLFSRGLPGGDAWRR